MIGSSFVIELLLRVLYVITSTAMQQKQTQESKYLNVATALYSGTYRQCILHRTLKYSHRHLWVLLSTYPGCCPCSFIIQISDFIFNIYLYQFVNFLTLKPKNKNCYTCKEKISVISYNYVRFDEIIQNYCATNVHIINIKIINQNTSKINS